MEYFLTVLAISKACLFFLAFGFLPGCILCRFLGVKTNLYLWSHVFSILIFSVSSLIISRLNIDIHAQLAAIISFVAIIFLCLFSCFQYSQKCDASLKVFFRLSAKSIRHFFCTQGYTFSFILLSVLAYLIWVGPYDLVPSDILRHMERIQFAIRDINHIHINDTHLLEGISGHYHYYFYANILLFSGISIHNIFWIVSLVNSTLLLWALSYFSRYVWLSTTQNAQQLTSLFTIFTLLLFVLTKGIAEFSFIRYYSLAPTLLSFAVLLILIVLFDKCFKQGLTKQTSILLFSGLLMLLLWHVQELLFFFVYAMLLSSYYLISHICLQWKHKRTTIFRWLFVYLCVLSTLILSIITIRSQSELPSIGERLISLTTLFQLFLPNIALPEALNGMLVLNPFIQFAQVIGFWGVLVYVCAALYIKTIIKNPILFCGLVIPVFTVFNPIFVDVFLRVRGEDVLYRLLYAVPLSAVAAWILCQNLKFLIRNDKVNIKSIIYAQRVKVTIMAFSFLALIFGLIPFSSKTYLTSYNRINDIFAVEPNQSLRHWQDISHALNQLPKYDNVLTDPLTAYIITATTHSIAKRYKFTKAQHTDLNQLESQHPSFSGGLLVVNLREGGLSRKGAISRHWPEDILHTRKEYSKKLLQHIENNPKIFELIWHQQAVSIYKIH